MFSHTIRSFACIVLAGIGVLGLTLLTASTAHAQVAISEEGVTFPDDETQTAAVIVPMNCPHGDAIVWDTNAESWVCETDLSPPPTYDRGDTGPAGGIVFLVTDGGLHGLEAALEDQALIALWCSNFIDIAGVDNIVDSATPDSNSGTHNTPLIAAVCDATSAAGVAADYVWPNGQTDGFLPNKEELDLIYQGKDQIGGFVNGTYWSSSEVDAGIAWGQNFFNGNSGVSPKSGTFSVRAIRAF